MTASSPSPEHYRAFAPGKLVRTGILTDAWARGGLVWARHLTGTAQHLALCRKMAEELTEAITAGEDDTQTLPIRRDAFTEELADVMETTLHAQSALGLPAVSFTKPSLRALRHSLQTLHKEWSAMTADLAHTRLIEPDVKAWFKDLLQCNASLIADLTFRPPPWFDRPLGLHTLQSALEDKRRRKGPLEGWYLAFIALPSADPFARVFAEKHSEVNLSYLNLAEKLQPFPAAA